MVTLVGTQPKFEDALYELCELDYDAVEAYTAAINRLKNEDYKTQLRAFREDHQHHIENIRNFLKERQVDFPEGPSSKSLLTQGKVVLANLFGDKNILETMLSNEMDTNTAYERLNAHPKKPLEAELILSNGLADEKRHKQWLQTVLKGLE